MSKKLNHGWMDFRNNYFFGVKYSNLHKKQVPNSFIPNHLNKNGENSFFFIKYRFKKKHPEIANMKK